MSTAIIITLCSLLLIAYAFDLSSARTRIPSVILLLLLGWILQQASGFFELQIPGLSTILPVLGTLGLILIVLEGSLELELDPSKKSVLKKSLLMAVIPLFSLAFLSAFCLQYFGGHSFKDNLTNAIPFCVISSAIAIPSVKNLSAGQREFVIYESSLSDIIGVLFFNFVALNQTINAASFGEFAIQILLIAFISFVATIGLSYLLGRIEHPIKFGPIILLVILIYAISKVYHLPGLLFILLFGLFLGNLDALKRFSWIEKLKPDILNTEAHKFKELLVEATFLVRSLFFLVFGFLIRTEEILDLQTLAWSAGIVCGIFLLRGLQLRWMKLPLRPLLFIAPRGLITVLLFFAILPHQQVPLVNRSLIIQVIILTALVMMFGLMREKRERPATDPSPEN